MNRHISSLLPFKLIALLTLLLLCLSACTTSGNGDPSGDESSESTAPQSSEHSTDSTSEAPPESTLGDTFDGTETAEPEPPAPSEPEPADFISQKGTLLVTMTEIFTMSSHYDASGTHCRVVQGGCTDGTYYYVVLNDGQSSNAASVSTICKYEIATGTLVASYENIRVAHGNDLTYNADTHEIIAVHNSPERQTISILDADTLTFKEKKTVELEIYSIAYDPYEQCYWVGISYGFDFAKLDLEFNQIGEIYQGYATGYTKQGMDVDSKYIYFCQYKLNSIIVYDKTGNFVREIVLPKTSYEAENVFHIGDTFYIGYYKSSAGGMLYRTELSVVGSAEATAEMTEILILDRYTDGNGNICKVAQGSCTDGTYLYLMMNNDTSTGYISALCKIDLKTNQIIKTVEGFETGLTNDLTYNPKTNRIIAVHNKTDAKVISVIDADTLTLVETKTLSLSIYAMAYDETNDCYWVALSGGYDFAKLDANFNKVGGTYTGYATGYTKQAIDCDGTYLYFIQSAVNNVVIYRVSDGSFVGIAPLLPSANTAQSICHVGDTFYIGYNVSEAGGILYTASITIKE